jgi:basic amino acid/polyamine antiporter, APA family
MSDAPPGLRRVLGIAGLTSLGVGGTIGTGIFVMVGTAAKEVAGPAILVSFLVAALACGCAALCYARLAGRFPQAGSAYAYGRALAPPGVAFLIGWNLLVQYALAAASIGQGWSHYFQDALIALFGRTLPIALRSAGNGHVDLSALLVTLGITGLLLRGITPSLRMNHLVVAVKLALIALILGVGAFYIRPENWKPLAPFGWGGLQLPFLASSGPPRGVLAGAALVFYAFLGFEALTNYSEESKSPTQDVPKSILRSLAICTVLYIAMATTLTGMVRYDMISKDAPISAAFGQVGLPWIRTVVAVGALLGITSVLLVILLSFPRILMAIGRDGVLPGAFLGKISSRGVPANATLLGGGIVAALTAFVPLDALGVVAVMANLITFLVVAVLVLRLGGEKIAPLVTILMCTLLLFSLPWFGGVALGVWWLIGVGIYAVRRRGAST